MGIFVNGIGAVTAHHFNPREKHPHFNQPESNPLCCLEPDYNGLVPPMQLRRMSKVVRIGIASSKKALEDAGLIKPEVITIGTAYGCLADTEIFLQKLLNQDESMLTPTSFIQSTHNTVSGQIALLTQCYGTNMTYVHKGHSFEYALQDAMLWIIENESVPNYSVLTGGIDELTKDSFDIIARFGSYKKYNETYDAPTEGTVGGEGSNMFVLSHTKSDNSYAELIKVHCCSSNNIQEEMNFFLKSVQLREEEIDTCFIGVNGDSRFDSILLSNIHTLRNAQLAGFKKFSGEYPTSNAFAFALACKALKDQLIPEELYLHETLHKNRNLQNVMIYNHYKNKYHSFILLRRI